MGRKKARDNAFKCIYQLEFLDKNNLNLDEILEFCFEENANLPDEQSYIGQALHGVVNSIERIDNIIL